MPPKPFKFFNFWAIHGDFLRVVDSWRHNIEGSPMQILFDKLKKLKPILKKFNERHFS